MAHTSGEPAFCRCVGSRQGFYRSRVTGFWVCNRCDKPTEAWWQGQKAEVAELAEKGLCSKNAGVHSKPPKKCKGYAA